MRGCAELAIDQLWDQEVKGQGVDGLRYGQAHGRGRNSPSLSGTHDRKVKPGGKVRILSQVFAKVQSAELYVEVPENYGGNFPLYLIKVSLRAGWAPLPPRPASPTSSLSISFLLCLSFNPDSM